MPMGLSIPLYPPTLRVLYHSNSVLGRLSNVMVKNKTHRYISLADILSHRNSRRRDVITTPIITFGIIRMQ